MTKREKIFLCIAIGLFLLLAVSAAVGLNRDARRTRRETPSSVTVTDTVWTRIHDTVLVEVERRIVRVDTVRLPAVNLQQIVVPCDTSTAEDCSAVDYKPESTDSVAVEVPISAYLFEGENYRIKAMGYAVSLTDIWIDQATVTRTTTVTRTKRWAFGVGVQAGYGITLHGPSPYAGLGLSFGYVF